MTTAAERPSSLAPPPPSSSSTNRPPFPSPLPPGVVVENGLLKSIHGWTWPGIEWGEAPGPRYTYYEYLQALRDDDLPLFELIQRRDRAWWHHLTDRGGTGCSLHAAVDASALRAVRFLVEVLKVDVNVRARADGATPLHRAAAVAHHVSADDDDDDFDDGEGKEKSKAMRVFEYLLSKGSDPRARARGGGGGGEGGGGGGGGRGGGDWRKDGDKNDDRAGDDEEEEEEEKEEGEEEEASSSSISVLDFAVDRGHGWRAGEVRARLSAAIERASPVPKGPLEGLFKREGKRRGRGRGRGQQLQQQQQPQQRQRYPPIAAAGASLLRTWRLVAPSLPYPPPNWRPPPPAGWAGAVGILECRRCGSSSSSVFGSSSGFSVDADVDDGGVVGGWRPAGSPGDGSCWLRKATKEELDAQAAAAAAVADGLVGGGE